MKTIVRKSDAVSLFLFSDDEFVDIQEFETFVGNPLSMIISDCNLSNCELIFNVETPDDWWGGKYKHDGTSWSLTPNWVDPRPPRPEEPQNG